MLAQSAEALCKIVADSKHGGCVEFSSYLINSSAIAQGWVAAEAGSIFERTRVTPPHSAIGHTSAIRTSRMWSSSTCDPVMRASWERGNRRGRESDVLESVAIQRSLSSGLDCFFARAGLFLRVATGNLRESGHVAGARYIGRAFTQHLRQA